MTPRAKEENTHHSTVRRGLNWKGVLQLLVGVGALTLAFAKSDVRGVLDAILQTRFELLPVSIGASFAVTWLMAYRWRVILGSRGHRIGMGRLFAYYLIATFFQNFVPGGSMTGDATRLIYVDRLVRDKALVLSTLIYERIIGTFALFLIGLIATLLSHVYVQTDPMIYIGEAALGIAFLGVGAVMSESLATPFAAFIARASASLRAHKAGAGLARTILGISSLRHHEGLFLKTLGISLAVRLVWCAGCYVAAQAMGLPIGVSLVFAFISLADLVRLMPISVGGVGVREWALVALFATVGIGQERALTFSLLAFAPLYVNAIVGGILYLSRARITRAAQAVGEFDLDTPAA
jgi:uncharacterized protein (TIRG00374 family)